MAKLKASRDELFDRVLNTEAAAREEVGASRYQQICAMQVMLGATVRWRCRLPLPLATSKPQCLVDP